MEGVTKIDKEAIRDVKFVPNEVLKNAEDIRDRKADLDKATQLGNTYRSKAKITFETNEGLRQVETHIWASTEKNVTLKGGILIPIRSIHRVDFL